MQNKRFALRHDVSFTYQRLHKVRAKAGTPVQQIGGSFALRPEDVETDSPRGRVSLWAFDTTYYYIWADEKDVEELKQ